MKRLITCTDGTWDKPGDKQNGKSLDSNVCLLYNAITETADDGIQQMKVYDTGVGTSYTLSDQMAGGITGAGLDKKIKDVYTFLILGYEPGDEIYLFGFSRGAYTARSLAGFIRNCGILKPAYLHLLDKAYELYRDRNDYTTPDADMMIAFRKAYCAEDITPIKFIGVWDTVGSLGIPFPWFDKFNMEKYKFHDITLSSTVQNAYQALAVNEHRKLFEPSIWQLSSNNKLGSEPVMEQRWFAGVHCDVGGGYINRGLSNDTLQWLAGKAAGCGLDFDETKLGIYISDPLDKMGDSYTLIYHLMPKVWRAINQLPYSNQVVDESVYERITADPNYRPKNVPPRSA